MNLNDNSFFLPNFLISIQKGPLKADQDNFIKACKEGSLEIVKKYAENGGDVHIRNDIGFYEAIENNHFKIVKYLCEEQEVNQAYFIERGYLQVLEYMNYPIELIDYFVKNFKIDKKNIFYSQCALSNGMRIVRYFIENDIINDWKTIFIGFMSACSDSLEIVKYLVETKKVDLKYRRIGEFAISKALHFGRFDISEYLVKKGVKLYQLDFHKACEHYSKYTGIKTLLFFMKYIEFEDIDIYKHLIKEKFPYHPDVYKYRKIHIVNLIKMLDIRLKKHYLENVKEDLKKTTIPLELINFKILPYLTYSA